MERIGSAESDKAHRAGVIAQATRAALVRQWQECGLDPVFDYVRKPEIGLVALRGRIGGGGAPFPFAEATATRASVRLSDGAVGHAVVLGRDPERATISAVVDALSADPECARRIDDTLIAPLLADNDARDRKRAAETAATRVDFFTLVRGED